MVALALGPEADGGIAVGARPAFDRWAQGVHAALGNLWQADQQRLAQALAKNAPLYDDYMKLRDQAEAERFERRRANSNLPPSMQVGPPPRR